MKKKLLGLVLASSLAFSAMGQVVVCAENTDYGVEAISAVGEKQFDTDYSVTWNDDVEQCENKITLTESGIVELQFTKPENKTLGIIDMEIYVYDDKENCICKIIDEEDAVNGSVYIGLDKGVYYINFEPKYSGYVEGKSSSYKFTFKANANCEKESNNQKSNATSMKVDTVYTGYLGGGFGNISDDEDEQDVYEIKLKKGHVYQLEYKKEQGTTIVKMLGKNTDFDSLWPSDGAKDFCVAPGESFIAPYSGEYFINIYNYGGKQYKYTTKVVDLTPKATTLTSVSGGNDAFTAKWKKESCFGYQIQYSTSKIFKNAKTVSVSKSRTSTAIKKLANKKKYYVRIRTYKKVGKKSAYSSWSAVKTVTTK